MKYIRQRQILYDFTYMWNLKNKTNKHNKTETELQIQRTNTWLPEWRGAGGGEKYVREIKRYKLPAAK